MDRMLCGDVGYDKTEVEMRPVFMGVRDGEEVFFFQAEDGIRDYKVTGVQTCALPISNLHQVCGSARDNEDGEADEHPVELQIYAPANEIEKGEGYREVCDRYERIGEDRKSVV